MLTVTAILDQYAWVYSNLIPPAGTWDLQITMDGGVNGLKVEPDGTVGVHIHGSEDLSDWEHDFSHFALPVDHPSLGPVHPGFLAGALTIKPVIDQFAGERPIAFYGHSYGAGRASILAALRVTEGKPVARLEQFGEPKAGGPKLRSILANVPGESHRNAKPNGDALDHDLVTDVPFNLGQDIPYCSVREKLTDCYHQPRANDPWLFFKWHHAGHYARAFGCGGAAALSLST